MVSGSVSDIGRDALGWRLLACAVVLLVLAAGCAGSADPDPAGQAAVDTTEAAAEPTASIGDRPDPAPSDGDGGAASEPEVASGPFTRMLAAVPDTGRNRQLVSLSNIGRAVEQQGLTRPDPDDDEAVLAFHRALLHGSGDDPVLVAPTIQERLLEPDSWQTELGFTFLDIELLVGFGDAPENVTMAWTERDATDIVDTIRSDPTWGPTATGTPVDGATVLTWPGDPAFIDPDRTTGARPLGQAGLITVFDDGPVVRSTSTALNDRVLAALGGETPSLADNHWFGGIGRVFDDLDLSGAVITTNIVTRPALPDDGGLSTYEPALPPYQALGLGFRLDDDGQPLLIVSFATPGPDEAAVMVDAFRTVVEEGISLRLDGTPWSEYFAVVDSTTTDNIATITLEADYPTAALQVLRAGDTLFLIG